MVDTPPTDQNPLNPVLRAREDETHDLTSTRSPIETTSAREGEGEIWPWVWLIAAVIGAVLMVYFII